MIVILYTTKYREGGEQFRRAAMTLSFDKGEVHSDVRDIAVESKQEVKDVFREIANAGAHIDELHFIGHSGMYGPMFGTRAYPEQFSPWEWRQLSIPFAKNSEAFFSCCRSARWFAPFFAETFGVTTHGYHWYTTFSKKKDKFSWDGPFSDKGGPLYSIGCQGRKSHGIRGSLRKYLGIQKAEEWKTFAPDQPREDGTYNEVAELYDAVFQDITVRKDEWEWLQTHLPNTPVDLLDIGCGNGALLRKLGPQLKSGVGVDVSAKLLEQARQHPVMPEHISFQQIDGPTLPFPDNHFDVATSLLSFRYLDWDPLMEELKRVIRPGGKLLVIDMVTAPVRISEFPQLLKHKLALYRQQKSHPDYYAALRKLVSHPEWKRMLKYNPIRSEHEMKWYLESRFPGAMAERINIGWNARVLAFDSGDIEHIKQIELTYP